MDPRKNDLKIIYNLEWKNKPANGGDKANIVALYDVPATTLNWEVFKSYLLKNSGTVGDDVKITFISEGNSEFPITSQSEFQVALYAFRRKAIKGQIVNLRLERISNQAVIMKKKYLNDVETQSENNEPVSLSSTCCNIETPPDWFVTFMEQFRKSVTEEITDKVANIVSNIKPQIVSQPTCYHLRKASKSECPKRARKLAASIVEPSHETKELLKSIKLEGKLEKKLEKLEHKTKKIKEKKLALFTKSSDSEAGQSSSRSQSYRNGEDESEYKMDACPMNTNYVVPHMLGGEIYLHQWEVKNTGKLPWTSKTSLNFTWGSKALKALDTVLSVPYLKPGEVGTIAVRLQVPEHPGQYECYWHFKHKDRRFGHWLGCTIIVDPFDLKGNKSVLETSLMSEFVPSPKKFEVKQEEEDRAKAAVSQYTEIREEPTIASPQYTFNIEQNKPIEIHHEITMKEAPSQKIVEKAVKGIIAQVEEVKLQEPTDSNFSSDSDNQSIVSVSESEASRGTPEEFVVVPMPDCFKIDQPQAEDNVLEQKTQQDEDLATDSFNDPWEKVSRGSSEKSAKSAAEQQNRDGSNSGKSGNSSFENLDGDDLLMNRHRKSDMVISFSSVDIDNNTGYAYLIADGRRLSIPEKILNSDYIKLAKEKLPKTSSTPTYIDLFVEQGELSHSELISLEEKEKNPLPTTEIKPDVEQTEQKSDSDINGEFMSHCSAAGSSFSEVEAESDKNSRMFIFPQGQPGYEVIYPVLDMPESSVEEYKWSESSTQYAFTNISAQPTTTASAPPLNLSTHNRNPFKTNTTSHVPNYQQTPPDMRTPPPTTSATTTTSSTTTATETEGIPPTQQQPTGSAGTPRSAPATPQSENTPPIHILPENFVTGAVNVASSAINTARSVINRIMPNEPGRWVNGHWVSTNPETPREANLQALAEMGFWNRDLNATLLARYNDDLSRVVAELVQ